ncbi:MULTISPECIES: nucleotidyltransferase domain-containing protein [unclassified Nocardia]|uniref:nucleotidyltransferase domain-containing protein n=1 Tax=unclassified Nocardia TaxID=2637762 RepID=UPI001CE3B91F|nr:MULTISPECIES: nucleotidyltransferase domain-containing protein [unclassified Nocardia]
MAVTGLDADGFIAREGSLSNVQPEFAPLVARTRELISDTFGPGRLHSAYLYGSVPRGTAVPGVSDLDVLLALHREPTEEDRADADRIGAELDAAFAQIDGAGMQIAATTTLLDDIGHHDLGWMVACLCTPLLGDDLADRLPRYRPTARLARAANADLDQAIAAWRAQLDTELTDADRITLCRKAARRIVRTGFTLVMPRWGGWTSDLQLSATIFGRYYPTRAAQMRTAATAATTPDPAVLDDLINDLAPWLAAEYDSVLGPNTPVAEQS